MVKEIFALELTRSAGRLPIFASGVGKMTALQNLTGEGEARFPQPPAQ
jgi:hypothetical protein